MRIDKQTNILEICRKLKIIDFTELRPCFKHKELLRKVFTRVIEQLRAAVALTSHWVPNKVVGYCI